jgi:hypothetical protein
LKNQRTNLSVEADNLTLKHLMHGQGGGNQNPPPPPSPVNMWVVAWHGPLHCNIPDIKSMQNINKMLEMVDEQQYN